MDDRRTPGAGLEVEALGGDRWRVRVGRLTSHEVTAAPAALQRASAREGEPAEETLRRTFDFLLEREPAESILSRFSLEDVARYFPDFWSVMSATP